MRTSVPLTRSATQHLQSTAGPRTGRLVLLLAAYAPVAVIIGLRGLPAAAAWIATALGVVGIAIWAWFLWWAPKRQPREVDVTGLQYVDAEVTGYIVSLLLPLVAAGKPDVNDWLAYGFCGGLILLVAYVAELWSVNPTTYLLKMRAARATIDGEPRIVLVSGPLGNDGRRHIVQKMGVIFLLGPTEEGG